MEALLAPPPITSQSSTVVYLHGDHLGSISAVTSSTGGVISSQSYDTWGKVLSGGNVTQTKLNYTGQRLDDTGLLYYHARYYDPVLGRFVSPDSIVPSTGVALQNDFNEKGVTVEQNVTNRKNSRPEQGPTNPQNLNRYSYVTDNPLLHVDPTGHCLEQDDCTGEGRSPGSPPSNATPPPSPAPVPATPARPVSSVTAAAPTPTQQTVEVPYVAVVPLFLEALAEGLWTNLTATGSRASIVSNMSNNDIQGYAKDVLGDTNNVKTLRSMLNNITEGDSLGNNVTDLGNGLKEIGSGSRADVRVIVRRISNIDGKPAYEVISIFKKNAQAKVFTLLQNIGIKPR